MCGEGLPQQTHLEAIRDDPEAMWRKLESVHMQKRPGTRVNTYNTLLSLSKSEDESLSTLSTQASQLKSDMKALLLAAAGLRRSQRPMSSSKKSDILTKAKLHTYVEL